MSDRFRNRPLLLATMHGKEQVIAPILERELGVKVIVPSNFDTDRFGTFTRDVRRAGNQIEAARAKVRAGMEVAGADLGIASEGSFGPHPDVPFLNANSELLVLVDALYGLEILGHHRSLETNMRGEYVRNLDEARQVAFAIGFPEHGVVVRESERGTRKLRKDFASLVEFDHYVVSLLSNPFRRKIYIESDMRAHRNPTRMRNIEKAALDLVANMRVACPECGAPGFAIERIEAGLPCRACARPTDRPSASVRSCQVCGAESRERMGAQEGASPADCEHCNP